MVYINIRSIDYLWKFWMEIVDQLYLFDCLIFLILVSIVYCDVDNWFCGGLLSWSKRVACMVL